MFLVAHPPTKSTKFQPFPKDHTTMVPTERKERNVIIRKRMILEDLALKVQRSFQGIPCLLRAEPSILLGESLCLRICHSHHQMIHTIWIQNLNQLDMTWIGRGSANLVCAPCAVGPPMLLAGHPRFPQIHPRTATSTDLSRSVSHWVQVHKHGRGVEGWTWMYNIWKRFPGPPFERRHETILLCMATIYRKVDSKGTEVSVFLITHNSIMYSTEFLWSWA